jgi:uncharacterized protein (DUF1697 family)
VTTYIALLRGINVGGHKMIKMAELKGLFEALGFQGVQTYIQSGNVLFQSEEADVAALRGRIEKEIEARFGFQVPAILRTAAELQQVVADCPFTADKLAEGESLYVYFLAEMPPEAGVAKLLASQSDVDEYRLVGRDMYLLCRQSIRDSIFTNAFLEKRLGVPVTSRNWQVTAKLAEMGRLATF